MIAHLFTDTFDAYTGTESLGTGGEITISYSRTITAGACLFEPLSASERPVESSTNQYFTTQRMYCSTSHAITDKMIIKDNATSLLYDVKGILKYTKGGNPHSEIELQLNSKVTIT